MNNPVKHNQTMTNLQLKFVLYVTPEKFIRKVIALLDTFYKFGREENDFDHKFTKNSGSFSLQLKLIM